MHLQAKLQSMYSHQPEDYDCPFCGLAAGRLDADCVVYRTDDAFAVVALHQNTTNYGNILVVPNVHVENLYVFPLSLSESLMRLVRAVALALKEHTGCQGISIRQHNEPAGSQDVWHLHVHVTPRYTGDEFYRPMVVGKRIPAVIRSELAKKLTPLVAKYVS